MKRETGTTLVELIVVMIIIGVLTALALPNYREYVVKTRRTEAQVALVQAMLQQEYYFTKNNSYIAFSSRSTDPQELRFKWWSGAAAATSSHELVGQACAGQSIAECVELRAIPGTNMVEHNFRDQRCETLYLTSTGGKWASGAEQRCWP